MPSMELRRHPSASERRAIGRNARKLIKRSALARWDQGERRDPLAPILAQNQIRLASLVPIRRARMAESPWTFYRGAAAVMATDLASRPNTGLLVQLCGDAHILNFGLWATPERQLAFDLRDFDETLPGPFEWDLSRLIASIVVLARESGLDERVAEEAVAGCLRSYRRRMGDHSKARQQQNWYELVSAHDLGSQFKPADREQVSAHIARKARRRTSRGALKKLTEKIGGHLRITEDPPLRVHLDDDELALEAEVFAAYRGSLWRTAATCSTASRSSTWLAR